MTAEHSYQFTSAIPPAKPVAVDTPEVRTAARPRAQVYWFHPDHLGTGTLITDLEGRPHQFFLNLPYGETFIEQGGHTYDNPYIPTSVGRKELDEETGLYYYGARYYDPKISLWLSVDPLAEKYPGMSPYVYTYANPLKFEDPTGMAPEDDYFINKNGTIEVIRTNDNFDRFFLEYDNGYIHVATFSKNEYGLIQLPRKFQFTYDFSNPEGSRSFGFVSHTSDAKRFLSGEAVAVLIGALNEARISDLSLGQFSLYNGASPPPSKSHIGGKNGDLRLLRKDRSGGRVTVFDQQYDIERTSRLTAALYKFGYKDILSERNKDGKLASNTRHFSGYRKNGKWISVRHHHHLHLQGFRPNIIEIKGPIYGDKQKYYEWNR